MRGGVPTPSLATSRASLLASNVYERVNTIQNIVFSFFQANSATIPPTHTSYVSIFV